MTRFREKLFLAMASNKVLEEYIGSVLRAIKAVDA